MKWFGRKGVRGGARPFLFAGWAGAQAAEWPRSYEGQVREAYLQNAVAQRSVRLVAEAVASSFIYEIEEKDSPSTGSGRAVSLLTASLLEAVAGQLLLHGNAFVRIVEDGAGLPAELHALRPERVKVEADASGWPVAYEYKVGAAATRIAARDGLGRPGLAHTASW